MNNNKKESGVHRMVIAGDSLSLPRRIPEPVPYHEVWPTLLQEFFDAEGMNITVLNKGHRARTLPDFVAEFDDIVGIWEPRYVIVQIGIVDCAPRVLSKKERAFLNRMNWHLRRPIIKFISKHRRRIISSRALIRYTPYAFFKENLNGLQERIEQLEGISMIILPILRTFPALNTRSPGYNESVDLYNREWSAWAKIHGHIWIPHDRVQGDLSLEEMLLSDGHHLSVEGNRRVFRAVLETLMDETGMSEDRGIPNQDHRET